MSDYYYYYYLQKQIQPLKHIETLNIWMAKK